jgi:hypothetical protein
VLSRPRSHSTRAITGGDSGTLTGYFTAITRQGVPADPKSGLGAPVVTLTN